MPPEGSDVFIAADAVIPAGYTAIANQISLLGGSITVADGGQLKHNTQGLVVTMEKSIAAFNEVNNWSNYYLLAFPFSEDVAVPSTMTANEDNDFYTFDSNYPNAEWRNNKQHVITTVGGTIGYLYANPEDIELSLTGSTYQSYDEASITVEVTYSEGSNNTFNGWALLGNPYTCNAYVYAFENGSCVPKEFMVYDADGELVRCLCSSVAPMQGFFVKVEETTTICIKTTSPYVDLGLPSGTLWAACNVGAVTPEDYGDYFAWGETQPKDFYGWSTYLYCNGSYNTLTKYCSDASFGYNVFSDTLSILLREDDAATANWGNDWRMPTKEEWQELYNNTTHVWTTQNGVNGRLFTSENGNSLFLPAGGIYSNGSLGSTGSGSYYWSSSLSIESPNLSWQCSFYSNGCNSYEFARFFGLSVRPVRSGIQSISYIIDATANPTDGGEVSGSGFFIEGTECTLTATANEGYTFTNWTENDEVVSTEAVYIFTVDSDRTLVANFTYNGGGNDHEYVDLGLPSGTLWATCNIGANVPEECGDYFAWGETQPKEYYSWSNYQYSHGSNNTLTKYCNNLDYGYNGFTDNLTTLKPTDDAATANWGAGWCTPTYEDWQELYNNTTCIWTTQNYVYGRLFTAPNGNSLFLPAAGAYGESNYINLGIDGGYWSSSLRVDNPSNAWYFYFWSGFCAIYDDVRALGRSVRAVLPIQAASSYSIEVMPNPFNGGVITGTGNYDEGATCTLTATANSGYTFVNWTENGEVVSTEATYSFIVTNNRNLVVNFIAQSGVPTGAINGLFSINANGDQVYFSQGNLQYRASTNTWRFAENQQDVIGYDNSNISSTYDGWIDLFGWGTSGYDDKYPWMTSEIETDYGDNQNNIAYTEYDWGQHNPISNGGNLAGLWRILSSAELGYMVYQRNNWENLYSMGLVNGWHGLILLPDNCVLPEGIEFTPDYKQFTNDINNFSLEQWSQMEAVGAVFLPVAGVRQGTQVSQVDESGYYWSTDILSPDDGAREMWFGRMFIYYNPGIGGSFGRHNGISVRLVHDANQAFTSYSIEATPNPSDGGTITGTGFYAEEATCTLTATANDGYTFVNWTENGEVVSVDASYSFTVTCDRSLTANFTGQNGVPIGAINGLFSINANGDQVYFSQGNLQYRASTNTWRFAENQRDVIGYANSNISSTYDGWIDLFGWGTSGYDDKYPWMTSMNEADYGDNQNNIAYTEYDWGQHNPISNGGNQAGLWRTLSSAELGYMIYQRDNWQNLYAMGLVNDWHGLIILPDDFVLPEDITFTPDYKLFTDNVNNFSLEEWSQMESLGAVFLPVAGIREGTQVREVDASGLYWSTDILSPDDGAREMWFGAAYIYYNPGIGGTIGRHCGISIRLVQDAGQTFASYSIEATSNPSDGGTITGTGFYAEGATCTLTATANDGYTFVNWTENGEIVSAEATYSFPVMNNRNLMANFTVQSSVPTGTINGLFSINANGDQVYFSQGNLQYQASTSTWRFAENQWDYVGDAGAGTVYENGIKCNNVLISSTYNGWIDLFAWGTSGYNHGAVCYQPWSTSSTHSDYYAYGTWNANLNDQTGQADWGCNPIINGGNQENQWRTLTNGEWDYIFFTRNTLSGIRFVRAVVNDVFGIIVLPDDWNSSIYGFVGYNSIGTNNNENTISLTDWETILEPNGVIFLPGAGRMGYPPDWVDNAGFICNYWTATYYNDESVYCLDWYIFGAIMPGKFQRGSGRSVRLVQDAE